MCGRWMWEAPVWGRVGSVERGRIWEVVRMDGVVVIVVKSPVGWDVCGGPGGDESASESRPPDCLITNIAAAR